MVELLRNWIKWCVLGQKERESVIDLIMHPEKGLDGRIERIQQYFETKEKKE